MSTLQSHIEARNAKSAAWVAEDPENRCASMMVSDPEYWAEMGVTTVEEFEAAVRRWNSD